MVLLIISPSLRHINLLKNILMVFQFPPIINMYLYLTGYRIVRCIYKCWRWIKYIKFFLWKYPCWYQYFGLLTTIMKAKTLSHSKFISLCVNFSSSIYLHDNVYLYQQYQLYSINIVFVVIWLVCLYYQYHFLYIFMKNALADQLFTP